MSRIEIMVTLTLVDSESLADMRQQPRTFLPLPAAATLVNELRAHCTPAAAHLATRLETAIADAHALSGER